MKHKIEWKDGDIWKQAVVQIFFSRNKNYWFKHGGNVYVFPNFKVGTEVLVKSDDKWVRAGRLTKQGVIFLGEGQSYSEMCQSKAAKEQWLRPVFT